MTRKTIGLLALGLLMLVGVVRHGGAQEAPRSVSIATLAPPGSTWMRVFEAWNRELRRRTDNTLQLRFYPGGVQGDESEVIRKIRNGRIDGAAVTAIGLAQVYRPALVFEMPGILDTYAQLDAARAALTPEMDPALEQAGFVILGWADIGINRIFSTRPVATPADLARTHPWAWRDDLVVPAIFQVVHANGVPLQVPEVLGALQTRRIDALVTTAVAALTLQWASRISYMTDWNAGASIGGTVIGKRTWDSLTPEQRTALRETGLQFHALARRNLRRDEDQAVRALGERNIQIVQLTPDQREQWKRVSAQVRQRLTGQVADQALITRVHSFCR